MTGTFELIDPPQLVEVKYFYIATDNVWEARPFGYFLWHDEAHWVIGKMVWKNTMGSGRVKLRRPKGKKIYSGNLIICPQNEPKQFRVHKPIDRSLRDINSFIFLGFRALVDIDFVKAEDRRIRELQRVHPLSYEIPRLNKPRPGVIV